MRYLKASIHGMRSDASLATALGGSSEADARKVFGDKVVDSWDDHVWADEFPVPGPDPVSPIAVIEDDAPDRPAKAAKPAASSPQQDSGSGDDSEDDDGQDDGGPADVPSRRGSTVAWAKYARSIGVNVPDDMGRDAIIAELEGRELLEKGA